MVFKATYAEASDIISSIIFISDQATNSRTERPDLLGGFFLLAETKTLQSKTAGTANVLRKLHLVEIQQTEVKVKKTVERHDKLEQIDTLTFGEETEKLIEFAAAPSSGKFFVFLLNRDNLGKPLSLKIN